MKDNTPWTGSDDAGRLFDHHFGQTILLTIQDYGPAGPEIYQEILERFRSKSIEIPYPQREIGCSTQQRKQSRYLIGASGIYSPAMSVIGRFAGCCAHCPFTNFPCESIRAATLLPLIPNMPATALAPIPQVSLRPCHPPEFWQTVLPAENCVQVAANESSAFRLPVAGLKFFQDLRS